MCPGDHRRWILPWQHAPTNSFEERNLMNDFTHHELKVIATCVRKYQKNMFGNTFYQEEYDELTAILSKLYPLAYSETYLDEGV